MVTTTPVPDYQEEYSYGDGSLEEDGFDVVNETNNILLWCLLFDFIGVIAVALVLGLTCIRHKSKFNLGPRIFTLNMMFFDAIHAIVSLFFDLNGVSDGFANFLDSVGLTTLVMYYSDHVRSLDVLVFNCSLVPMMAMSIVACYSTQRITDKGSIIRFTAAVIASDSLPLVIQIVNVLTAPSLFSWATPLYMTATFLLYFVQIVMSACAIVILHMKSKQFNKSASNKASRFCLEYKPLNSQDTGANKNLIRLLVFAAGPCLLQVPFALYTIVDKTSKGSELFMRMTLGVKLIFAMKPTVDVIFTLLFLGEYRQYTFSFCKWMREKLTGHKSGQTTTRVTEFNRGPGATHTPLPSTVSGHVNNIRDGARPSAIGRSSSLPVQITTISV